MSGAFKAKLELTTSPNWKPCRVGLNIRDMTQFTVGAMEAVRITSGSASIVGVAWPTVSTGRGGIF